MRLDVGFQRSRVIADKLAVNALLEAGEAVAPADQEVVGDDAIGLRGDDRLTVELHRTGNDLDRLAGRLFQRAIEQSAFVAGGGQFRAPAQQLSDFVAGRRSESVLKSTYRPGVVPSDMSAILPPFVVDSLRQAVGKFQRTMPGFLSSQAQLVGVETRTSSPLRIVRGEDRQSPSLAGLFPVGEGAGYAGGIVVFFTSLDDDDEFTPGALDLRLAAMQSDTCPDIVVGGSQGTGRFELAVAAAISLFGFHSGAALATVVGVLIEVPVMLSVVKIVNASRGWYESGQAVRKRGLTAPVGSTRTQPRPSSQTSDQACASDWRTTRYLPRGFQ